MVRVAAGLTRGGADAGASVAALAIVVRRPARGGVPAAHSRRGTRDLRACRFDGRFLEARMIVVLFRSKLVAEPEGYGEMAEEMEALAKTMPGFIDVKGYVSEDGERLTVVRWQDQETMRQWREQERHRVAQRTGRERWYVYYKMEVAEVVRETSFTRDAI